jgi:hypothetical protein
MPALTDTKIRSAKPTEKPYKLLDGHGLYLDVRPSGSKIWRYRYWITPERDGIFTIGCPRMMNSRRRDTLLLPDQPADDDQRSCDGEREW